MKIILQLLNCNTMRKQTRCLLLLCAACTCLLYVYFVWSQLSTTSRSNVRETWAPKDVSFQYWKTKTRLNITESTNKVVKMNAVTKPASKNLKQERTVLSEKANQAESYQFRSSVSVGEDDLQQKGGTVNLNKHVGDVEKERRVHTMKLEKNPHSRDAAYEYAANLTHTRTRQVSSKLMYLIYLCDSARPCGGWGDRQRGLVSSFVLASITGRKFGVIMTSPCNLTKFYVPKDVNWIIPLSELNGKSNKTVYDIDSNSLIIEQITTDGFDFNKKYPHEVIYLRTNVEYVSGLKKSPKSFYTQILPLWARRSLSNTFRIGWDMLMKPTQPLQKQLDNFFTDVKYHDRPQPLVCAHVRLGVSETIKMDTEIRTPMSALPVLWDFLHPYVQNGSTLFLATDSYTVRSMARERFGDQLRHTGGKIMHVDKQASLPNACEAFGDALLDQLILSKCDVLVTSRSIFSQRAAAIRGTVKDLYILYPRRVRKMILS